MTGIKSSIATKRKRLISVSFGVVSYWIGKSNWYFVNFNTVVEYNERIVKCRISSANMGQPTSIDEQYIDVAYLSEEEDDENDLLPFKMEYVTCAISSPSSPQTPSPAAREHCHKSHGV